MAIGEKKKNSYKQECETMVLQQRLANQVGTMKYNI